MATVSLVDAFRIRLYRDKKKPLYKYMVVSGKKEARSRKFFHTKHEAQTYVDQKIIELKNSGNEAINFPASLRVMALECDEQLRAYGKNIQDATKHYIHYLKATSKSCSVRHLLPESSKVPGRSHV